MLRSLVFPVLRLGYRLEVVGGERLEAIDRPCLFVSNHNVHLDQSLLLKSLPGAVRRRMAIAAAESDIFGNRFRGFWAALVGNAFPFANSGLGIRGSLANVVDMLNAGWHVLIFPEGGRTTTGTIAPFRPGAARLAQRTGVPVVPIRIDVQRPGIFEGSWPRGRVRVVIGEPFCVVPDLRPRDASRVLEQAVADA